MPSFIDSDIEFITNLYKSFHDIVGGKNIPDFYQVIHPDAEIKFNNETYDCDECVSLMNDFCAATQSMEVTVVKPIECINEAERTYVALSSWAIESLSGSGKVDCPMLAIISIKDNKIIQAREVINMGGGLNRFLIDDITVKKEALAR
ncbi:hypothetical protein D5085_08145 [Ectothiorhodospiraceae bacterium BW-2]|nr:hypothetical protein D5085_08145 [Ectothiorhodospiraceae bacterium BW-2]